MRREKEKKKKVAPKKKKRKPEAMDNNYNLHRRGTGRLHGLLCWPENIKKPDLHLRKSGNKTFKDSYAVIISAPNKATSHFGYPTIKINSQTHPYSIPQKDFALTRLKINQSQERNR